MATDEQSLRTARALVERGILTQKAARLMTHFSASTRLFCEALRLPSGEVGIIWRDRWYTPAEFNALADDRYLPTTTEIGMSVLALAPTTPAPRLAASPEPSEPDEPTVEPDEADDEDDAADAQQPTPPPDGVVAGLRALADLPDDRPDDLPDDRPAPGSPEADAELEQIHQATSKRPGGAGALTWGLALLVGVFASIAALGFWQVAQLLWSR